VPTVICLPSFWEDYLLCIVWHCIAPEWLDHDTCFFASSHVLDCSPKAVIELGITQLHLNVVSLYKDFTRCCLDVTVFLPIHIDTRPLTRCCHVLLRELIVLEDLRLFGLIMINEGDFNATRVICSYGLFLLLSVNDRLGCCQVKLFEAETGLRRWLVEDHILKALLDLLVCFYFYFLLDLFPFPLR